MIEITQFSDLTSDSSTSRQVTLTSTDWSDIGTHTFKQTCYYTNYPDEYVEAEFTLTVSDCPASGLSDVLETEDEN